MILIIDTSNNEEIKLALEKDGSIFKSKRIRAYRSQAEKLLPAIEALVKVSKTKFSGIKKIKVAHRGGSFTALRIGILTANALAYALKVPVETIEKDQKKIKSFKNFNIVIPDYNRDLDIKYNS